MKNILKLITICTVVVVTPSASIAKCWKNVDLGNISSNGRTVYSYGSVSSADALYKRYQAMITQCDRLGKSAMRNAQGSTSGAKGRIQENVSICRSKVSSRYSKYSGSMCR